MISLVLGICIFAPVIYVCCAQAHFPPVSEIKQGYNDSMDAMHSFHENSNFKSDFPQYRVNNAGRKVLHTIIIID